MEITLTFEKLADIDCTSALKVMTDRFASLT